MSIPNRPRTLHRERRTALLPRRLRASIAPSLPIRVSLSTSRRPSTASTRSARPQARLTKTASKATVVGPCGWPLHPMPPRLDIASLTGHLRVTAIGENAARSTVVLSHGRGPPAAVMAAPLISVRLGLGTVDLDAGRFGPKDCGGANATIEPLGHV